jgi:hypothetical protein
MVGVTAATYAPKPSAVAAALAAFATRKSHPARKPAHGESRREAYS